MTTPDLLTERLVAAAAKTAADGRFDVYRYAELFAEAAQALLAAEARIERLTKALEPFAKIKPSSFYPDDGSEAEGYLVLLQGTYSNPVSFTGADLALARAALHPQQGEG
jgi:hypothetical protein